MNRKYNRAIPQALVVIMACLVHYDLLGLFQRYPYVTRYMYSDDRPMLHHRHQPVFDRTWLPGPGTDPNTFHWGPSTMVDHQGWSNEDNKKSDGVVCPAVGDEDCSTNGDTESGKSPDGDRVDLKPRSNAIDDSVQITTATVAPSPSRTNDNDDESGDSDDDDDFGDFDDDEDYVPSGDEYDDDVF